MQLKGLVWFFTIALIVISLYQLSFTWIVNSHESDLKAKAERYVKLHYADASADTKDSLYNARYHKLQDSTQDQIIGHCRPHLATYKLPRSVRFVPDLPKTSTGKVMRRELKTLDRSGQPVTCKDR